MQLLKEGASYENMALPGTRVKNFPYELHIHQEIIDYGKLYRIYFAQYFRNELRDD